MARKILGVTCTKSANTKAMRAPLEEEVSEPPGNVPIGTGTGWRSLRKICTALGAVSHVLPEVCKGREAAHLLLEDADMVVRTVRMQEARLATPCSRSGLLQSTSGIVILGLSGRLGSVCGRAGARVVMGFGRHLSARTSATATSPQRFPPTTAKRKQGRRH